MSVGSNGLAKDLTTQFGPDGQPYFGGQRTMNSFGSDPGGTAKTAWPRGRNEIFRIWPYSVASRRKWRTPLVGFRRAPVAEDPDICKRPELRSDLTLDSIEFTAPLAALYRSA